MYAVIKYGHINGVQESAYPAISQECCLDHVLWRSL